MAPRLLLGCLSLALALVLSGPARALQGGPVIDAAGITSPAPPAPSVAASSGMAERESRQERPLRGPSVRERGGRRSRGSSVASGALFLVMLVGAMGYYVVRRLRR